jgi:uncharacterized ubiquitin-like protein YukD
MKKLLLIAAIFSIQAHAENWLNHSKVKSGSIEAYSLKSDCERISNETCYDLGSYPSSVYSEVDSNIDDFNKPVYSKNEIQSCATNEICDSIHASKVCSDSLEYSIKNYDLNQVYCSRVIGYETKAIKIIELDSAKLSAYQAQEIFKTQARQKEQVIQFALKRIECVKRVIGLLVLRNSTKVLTTANIAQINSTYAPIKGLIDTGSLNTAKEQMALIVPDGTLITVDDKNDLISESDKCL